MKFPLMFDGWGFQPHGLIIALAVELGGKTISIQVEVVDTPLDYNLLLGRNWFYAMTAVASTTFVPASSKSNEVIICTVAVSMLRGVEGKIPIRDESFNMPTPIDW